MADPRVLLDSNICIYLLEGLSQAARERAESFEPGQLVTSSIAYAEVIRGLDPKDEDARNRTEALFRVVIVLPFDMAAANAYAQVPFKRGRFDRLIAAHALSLGIPVATNDGSGFADVPGLIVQNWTLP